LKTTTSNIPNNWEKKSAKGKPLQTLSGREKTSTDISVHELPYFSFLLRQKRKVTKEKRRLFLMAPPKKSGYTLILQFSTQLHGAGFPAEGRTTMKLISFAELHSLIKRVVKSMAALKRRHQMLGGIALVGTEGSTPFPTSGFTPDCQKQKHFH
jgi:hypothetical protein